MIEILLFLATKCNIHSVSCRFFECAAGVFKGSVRRDVKLWLEAFARGLLKNMAANVSSVCDVKNANTD